MTNCHYCLESNLNVQDDLGLCELFPHEVVTYILT